MLCKLVPLLLTLLFTNDSAAVDVFECHTEMQNISEIITTRVAFFQSSGLNSSVFHLLCFSFILCCCNKSILRLILLVRHFIIINYYVVCISVATILFVLKMHKLLYPAY